MKRYLGLLFVIVFTVSLQAFTQTLPEQKHPELPDFTQKPYVKDSQGSSNSILNPDWGYMKSLFYYVPDSKDPHNWKNAIMVFLNDDETLKYAEWAEINEEVTRLVIRGYVYKDKKWVYDKEIVKTKQQ